MDRTIRAGHLADHILLLYREFDDDEALARTRRCAVSRSPRPRGRDNRQCGRIWEIDVRDLRGQTFAGLIHVGEELVNKAYDASIVEPAGTQIGKARELFQHLSRELSPISPLPEVDTDIVAEGQYCRFMNGLSTRWCRLVRPV